MLVKWINVCLHSTLSTADKPQIVVELGPHTGNLCFAYLFSGTVELGKRGEKIVSFYIQLPLRSWEESNSHLIILHQINEQHLNCWEGRSWSALQPHSPALSRRRGHASFPASLGSQPLLHSGLGPDIPISGTCLPPISGSRQGAFTSEIPTCALYLEENFPRSRDSSHPWGLTRSMPRKGAGNPGEHTSTSPRPR